MAGQPPGKKEEIVLPSGGFLHSIHRDATWVRDALAVCRVCLHAVPDMPYLDELR
ncbi:MAG TPA: hypothetical protein PKG69_05730 [Methanoregulaceae archaeon]|nr:hypothetical protein [Methanoregulaceae archaeon]